jgi:hypothetical protein
MVAPGHTSGQPSWELLVDTIVAEHGSLAAVAARLAETRGWKEDAESIARALRRLRARGTRSGGRWGTRLLATFGLPRSVDARLRFMGSYHSRFVDLPVSIGTDLVQLWDRPPTSESRAGRIWLSLARAILAMRAGDDDAARAHLATARRASPDDLAGRIEIALAEARLAGEDDRLDALDDVPAWLDALDASPACDRAQFDCLRARYVGQVSHAHNRRGEIDVGEALHRALPDTPTTPAFARSRRANGLAYARHRKGDHDEALRRAWLAVRYAGDGGHVRLRAMALLMVARVAGNAAIADEARERARCIAVDLEDEVLAARCATSAKARRRRS